MKGCLKTLVARGIIVLLLIAAAYGGWIWGPTVFPRIHEWLGVSEMEGETEAELPTPELADSVLASLQSFRRGGEGSQMALGGPDLTAVLLYSAPGLVPEGVAEPRVQFRDGKVHLDVRVALEAFPELPDLGPILGILPDTLGVTLEGSLLPFGRQKAAILVQRVEASRIPLPRRLIPEILSAMGRENQPGLPPEAMAVSLPSGLGSAYILTDSLILSRDP